MKWLLLVACALDYSVCNNDEIQLKETPTTTSSATAIATSTTISGSSTTRPPPPPIGPFAPGGDPLAFTARPLVDAPPTAFRQPTETTTTTVARTATTGGGGLLDGTSRLPAVASGVSFAGAGSAFGGPGSRPVTPSGISQHFPEARTSSSSSGHQQQLQQQQPPPQQTEAAAPATDGIRRESAPTGRSFSFVDTKAFAGPVDSQASSSHFRSGLPTPADHTTPLQQQQQQRQEQATSQETAVVEAATTTASLGGSLSTPAAGSNHSARTTTAAANPPGTGNTRGERQSIEIVGDRPVVVPHHHNHQLQQQHESVRQSRAEHEEDASLPAVHTLSELRPPVSRIAKQQQGIFFVPPVSEPPAHPTATGFDFFNTIRPAADAAPATPRVSNEPEDGVQTTTTESYEEVTTSESPVHNTIPGISADTSQAGDADTGGTKTYLFQDIFTGQVGRQQENVRFIQGMTGSALTVSPDKIPDPDELMSRIESDARRSFTRPTSPLSSAQDQGTGAFTSVGSRGRSSPATTTGSPEDFDTLFTRQKEALERKFSAKEFDPATLSVTEFPNMPSQPQLSEERSFSNGQQVSPPAHGHQQTPPAHAALNYFTTPSVPSAGAKEQNDITEEKQSFRDEFGDDGRTRTIDFTIRRRHASGAVTTQTFKQIVPVRDHSAAVAAATPNTENSHSATAAPFSLPSQDADTDSIATLDAVGGRDDRKNAFSEATTPIPAGDQAVDQRQPTATHLAAGRQLSDTTPTDWQTFSTAPDKKVTLASPAVPVIHRSNSRSEDTPVSTPVHFGAVTPVGISNNGQPTAIEESTLEERRKYQEEQRLFHEEQRRYREQQRRFEEQQRLFEENRRRFEENQRRFEEQRRRYEEDKLRLETEKRNLGALQSDSFQRGGEQLSTAHYQDPSDGQVVDQPPQHKLRGHFHEPQRFWQERRLKIEREQSQDPPQTGNNAAFPSAPESPLDQLEVRLPFVERANRLHNGVTQHASLNSHQKPYSSAASREQNTPSLASSEPQWEKKPEVTHPQDNVGNSSPDHQQPTSPEAPNAGDVADREPLPRALTERPTVPTSRSFSFSFGSSPHKQRGAATPTAPVYPSNLRGQQARPDSTEGFSQQAQQQQSPTRTSDDPPQEPGFDIFPPLAFDEFNRQQQRQQLPHSQKEPHRQLQQPEKRLPNASSRSGGATGNSSIVEPPVIFPDDQEPLNPAFVGEQVSQQQFAHNLPAAGGVQQLTAAVPVGPSTTFDNRLTTGQPHGKSPRRQAKKKVFSFSLGKNYLEDSHNAPPAETLSSFQPSVRYFNSTLGQTKRANDNQNHQPRRSQAPQRHQQHHQEQRTTSSQPKDVESAGNGKDGAGELPGQPGVDYPNYAQVPPTSFSCKAQQSAGMYADIETNCQAFHNCDPLGHKMSFLCPNGTVFKQELFICDWWYNVQCSESERFFHLNTNKYTTPRPIRRRRRRGDQKRKAAAAAAAAAK